MILRELKNTSQTRENPIIRPIIRCKGNKKNLITKHFHEKKEEKLARRVVVESTFQCNVTKMYMFHLFLA